MDCSTLQAPPGHSEVVFSLKCLIFPQLFKKKDCFFFNDTEGEKAFTKDVPIILRAPCNCEKSRDFISNDVFLPSDLRVDFFDRCYR